MSNTDATFQFCFAPPAPAHLADTLGIADCPDNVAFSLRIDANLTEEQALGIARQLPNGCANPARAVRMALHSDRVDPCLVTDEALPALAADLTCRDGRTYRPRAAEDIPLGVFEQVLELCEMAHWESGGRHVILTPERMGARGITAEDLMVTAAVGDGA